MKPIQIFIGTMLVLASAAAQLTQTSFSASTYAQIVLPFKTEKEFHYDWLKSENTLVIQFPSTHPNELEAFNHYDERLVRRMIVKDLGPAGTEVRLVLKDRNVRALVTSFKDPFRVSIDLFDKDYAQKRDPISGLPIGDSGDSTATNLENPPAVPTVAADNSVKAKPAPAEPVESPAKRRLMQSLPDELSSPNELKAALAKIEPGLGKGWNSYPPYIYRAQLAPYEGREIPEQDISPFQSRAIKTSSAMADYAGKLYDFGHEGRALVAYQQVLLKEPGVFERDPLHLWKLAECHLGQGNFQLAEGYYTSLIDKHPTHALAQFAKLRKLDVEAIRSIQQNNTAALLELVPKLEALATKASPELTAQAMIRNSWWSDVNAGHDRKAKLPKASEEIQRSLTGLVSNVESQKTAFLASSLIAQRITRKDTPWEAAYAPWMNDYFSKFKGPASEPFRGELSTALKDRLSQEIRSVFATKNAMSLVTMFEGLPDPMKSIRKQPDIAWAIGESYRQIGQLEKSVPFYQTATNLPVSIDKFKAQFWLMSTAGNVAVDYRAKKGNQDKIRTLLSQSQQADTELGDTWSKLKSDEKSQIQTAMVEAIEADVASELKNKTPPRILLDKYTSALTVNPPKLSTATGNNPTDSVGNFSPTAGTVRLLDDLGKKFAALGMQPERRRALELMRFIKPASIEQDKTAQKIWTDQLLNLAEEHRKANEYLEAGELYSMIGDGGASNENRAEANYKGGLLLYRAGKKQEAIKALERAKSDPNNLFYSKLATERLDQLQAH